MTWLLAPKKSRKYGRARKFQLKLDELLLYATHFFLLSLADLSAACKFHACARATWASNPLALLCCSQRMRLSDKRQCHCLSEEYGVLSSHAIPTAQRCNPSRVDSAQCFRPPRCCLAFKAFSRETHRPPAEHSGALARINSLSAMPSSRGLINCVPFRIVATVISQTKKHT